MACDRPTQQSHAAAGVSALRSNCRTEQRGRRRGVHHDRGAGHRDPRGQERQAGARVRPLFYDRQEREGALLDGTGLGLGGADVFGPSWSLLDRLTSMHVDRHRLYETPHPTYVLTGSN